MGQRKRVKLSSSTKGKSHYISSHLNLVGIYSSKNLEAITIITFPCSFPVLLDPSIMDTLKHKCFLEELLFWTIKYEFPQKMVTFLLNMLPDQDYKVFNTLKRITCAGSQMDPWFV